MLHGLTDAVIPAMAIVLVTLMALVTAPKPDASCHGSPVHLGTDNIPTTASDRATTVVDMWYVAKEPSDSALFWIYQVGSGQRWVQENREASEVHLADAGEQQLLEKIGVFPCFEKPFPSDKLPDH